MTAIEWLKKELESYGDPSMLHIDWKTLDDLCEQAKQMEKEQIVNAHLLGLIRPLEIEATKQAEQYYNETYKK